MNRFASKSLPALAALTAFALAACVPASGPGTRMVATPLVESSVTVTPPAILAAPPGSAAPSPLPGGSSQSLMAQGLSKLQAGDYAGAESDFTARIQEDSQDALAYLGRGVSFAARSMWENAAEDFSRALAIDQELPEALSGRGEAYLNLDRLDEALADFDQFIRLRPDEPSGYRQRAWIQLLQQHPERVASDVNRAAELEGERAEGQHLMGLAQVEQGDYRGALLSQSKALELAATEGLGDSFAAAVLASRGQAYQELAEYPAAYDDLTRALQIGGPSVRVYELRAMVFYSQKRYADSAADHARAIGVDPNSAVLYNNLADSRMLDGNLDQALLDIETALRLDPQLGIAHYTKGEILEKMGRQTESQEAFKRAGELGFVPETP